VARLAFRLDGQPGWSATYPISEGVVAVYDQPGENWQPE
jgi:hypothetical protein